MYFTTDSEWSLLMELSQMDSRSALEWLTAHGVDLDQCDCGDELGLEDVDLDGDFELFLGGFWSSEVPVIEFEDGHVARWYRSASWD